jgi:AAA15 family ATPase/GTPase
MKIRRIEIENFRCHKNTLIQDCADFHTLFGGDATGKTNLIRSLNLLKSIGDRIDNPKDLLHQGFSKTGSKKIRIGLLLWIEKEERENYLAEYFNLSRQQIGQNPKILEKLALEFTIMCGVEKIQAGNSENHLILTKVQMSDGKGDLFPIPQITC